MLTPDWDGDMTAFTPERMKSYSAAETLCPDARYAELQSFRDYLSDGTGKHVLELGSGNGTLTACLQGMGWIVDTIDIAFLAPAGVRRHYNADIAGGLDFLPDDAEYDAVASLAVFASRGIRRPIPAGCLGTGYCRRNEARWHRHLTGVTCSIG